MDNFTIYPFDAPLLADLEHLDEHSSVLPVNPRVAQALQGTTHVLVSVHGHILRSVLHRRPDGQTCLYISNAWIREQGLEFGVYLDIEVAADVKKERELAREAELRTLRLMEGAHV